MPWLMLAVAVIYFVAAWQGEATLSTLNSNLMQDLPAFGAFALMVIVIWAIGMVPKMRKPAMLLLTLVILAIVLTNGGTTQFLQNIQNLQAGAGQANIAPSQINAGNASGSASGVAGVASSAASSITGLFGLSGGN